ncbi:MAG: excinuclease ABC subunit UvrC [Actinobacteria bacterium]|nr:excinuclease ABC subunit UvrC [Actinomycetota bacterium]
MVTKPPTGTIPETPGSYQFRDANGKVIYVGKAANLRQRLSNYFQDPRILHTRTAAMVAAAETVEWIEVRNEIEALMLEFNLIKEHRPRFNIRLRDDKSYPFLALTLDEQWPRAVVMRGRKRKGTKYFGPYPHAYAIRETLDLLLRTFPVRTCAPSKFKEHERLGRPCLLFHIEKCSGPCVNEVTSDDYQVFVRGLTDVLNGDADGITKDLEVAMREASSALDFEKAARLRDRLAAVKRATEKQQVVGDNNDSIDVIGIFDDDLEASVQVFYVRHGRVVGRRGFMVDKVEDLQPGQFLNRILENLYGDEPAMGYPKSVLVPYLPDDMDTYTEWLCGMRGNAVDIRIPQRGDKRSLHETVTMNAREEFTRQRMKRASDHNARSKALSEIQDLLRLPEAPLRIECYDMAHLHGTDYVGSMVVLEDGLPAKREYRRFKIKTVEGNDDYAAMKEVLTRRLSAYIEERDEPTGDKPGRFAYPPQLLLVDGGKGQLSVAIEVVKELGLEDEIPVASLAKKFEEVFIPGQSHPVNVPRGSEALYMLQRIRDEAHRFANSFHRELRDKRMKESVLDGIAGLGDSRRQRLLKELGTLKAVKEAPLEQLQALPWLPDAVALAIFHKIHGDSSETPT